MYIKCKNAEELFACEALVASYLEKVLGRKMKHDQSFEIKDMQDQFKGRYIDGAYILLSLEGIDDWESRIPEGVRSFRFDAKRIIHFFSDVASIRIDGELRPIVRTTDGIKIGCTEITMDKIEAIYQFAKS